MAGRSSLLKTAPVEPLDVNGVQALTVGTVLWALALVATLLFRSRLEAAGNAWWTWTCVTGVGIGLLGVAYFARRRGRAGSRT